MRSRAFTLLEILVAVFLASLIMGLGVGVLSRLDRRNELEATTQAVRALLRRAHTASQEERYGARVEIDPVRAQLRAQVRSAITGFRFESGEERPLPPPPTPLPEGEPAPFALDGARGYRLTVERAELSPGGKVGEALLLRRPAAWAWMPDEPLLSPQDGVAVECQVLCGDLSQTLYDDPPRPDPTREGDYSRSGEPGRPYPARVKDYERTDPPVYTVVRKGRAYALAVTAEYEVEVTVAGTRADEPGLERVYVARTRPNTLEPGRWARLGLVFDGREAALWVNGIRRSTLPLSGLDVLPELLIRDPAPLSVSDSHPDRGFFGMIDELRLAALSQSEVLQVPANVALIAPGPAVSFDLLGQLDPARHAAAFTCWLSDDKRALDLLLADPDQAAADAGGTRTRAELEASRAQNLGLDERRVRAFLALLPQLEEGSWRQVTVERSGLVR